MWKWAWLKLAANTKFKMATRSSGKTGDLKNNVAKLLREVRRMGLEVKIDFKGLCVGTPSSFLPIIHSALVQYSLPLAEWLVTQGYSLYSKSDLKFTEGFYRVLRDAFNYRPRLSKEQFLAKGYAERKVMLTHDLLLLCQDRHAKLTPTDRKRARRPATPTKHGRKVYGTEKNPPEVLTVQEHAGIGSAWKENVPIHNYAHDEPLRLEHYHTSQPDDKQGHMYVACDGHMHAIPTVGNAIHTHVHKHISPVHSPPRISPHASPRATSSPSQSPPRPSPSPPPSPAMPPATPLALVEDSNHVEPEQNRKQDGREEVAAGWQPLPLAPDEATGAGAGGSGEGEELLRELGSRVGQLTTLVERMSARFVVLETQLMLTQKQQEEEAGGGAGGREEGQRPVLARVDNNRPHLPAPPEVLGTPTSRHGTTPFPSGGAARPGKPLPDRLRAGLDVPSCHSPFLLDNNWRPRDVTACPLHSKRSHLAPAGSPNCEETRQLISKLRSRAQKTRLFLQQATTSTIAGRDV